MTLARTILLSTLCLAPLAGVAQGVDSTSEGSLYLEVGNTHFFKNNEYGGVIDKGYTLPGFTLEPKLVYQAYDNLAIELGAHWLHFWGADSYPRCTYWALPIHDSLPRRAHIIPWVKLEATLPLCTKLIAGSLGNGERHNLPMVLWDNESAYAADPEAGLALEHRSRYLSLDIWVDWRDFIFYSSPYQERFVFGSSALVQFTQPEADFGLTMPLHFIALHHGGEILDHHIDATNNFNAATGLIATLATGKESYLRVDLLAVGYHQHGNADIPFTLGWGLQSTVTYGYRALRVDASWWRSANFVSLLGESLFNNLSLVEPGLVLDRSDLVLATVAFTPQLAAGCTLTLDLSFYHSFATNATNALGSRVAIAPANSVTFGAIISLAPRFRLARF
ncbi:MAG: hypothetical protein IJ789_01645 [Bacteroidales bacterium]|nr:hypothetical protein [Bacteroidales bacterium]